MTLDIGLAILFNLVAALFFYTYVKVSAIAKRDGSAKLEINKRYKGILLDHVECLEETSVAYQTFRLMGLELTASTFFRDFEDNGNRMLIIQWIIRLLGVGLGFHFLLQAGLTYSFFGLAAALYMHSATFRKISCYYYLRYYEVDLMISDEDKDEE